LPKAVRSYLLFNASLWQKRRWNMDTQFTLEQFAQLSGRLDFEVSSGLREMLTHHHEIDLVVSRKLGTGVIFAAHTEDLLIEVRSAFMPVRKKSSSECTISSAGVKFHCTRLRKSNCNDLVWTRDESFAEDGFITFCLDPLDVDSTQNFTGLIADEILSALSPEFA
jgi:hypothetical protein